MDGSMNGKLIFHDQSGLVGGCNQQCDLDSSMDGSMRSSDFEDLTSPFCDPPSDDSEDDSLQGPLFELSSLMDQLPIKSGLSKFFHGKSQSFRYLSDIGGIEDLAKKTSKFKRKTIRRNSNKKEHEEKNRFKYMLGICSLGVSKRPAFVLHGSKKQQYSRPD